MLLLWSGHSHDLTKAAILGWLRHGRHAATSLGAGKGRGLVGKLFDRYHVQLAGNFPLVVSVERLPDFD